MLIAKKLLLVAAACGLAFAASAQTSAPAATWPDKPVTIVVPFPAGGSTDMVARAMAQHMGDKLGQNFVVDNRPGATGTLGAGMVKRAPADGYTLLVSSLGAFVVAPHLLKTVPYDALKDFDYITVPVQAPNVLVAAPGQKARTVKEVIAQLKASPGKVSFASSGNGSSDHLSAEVFWQQTGTEGLHIPYKGGAPALQDLLGGRVAAYYSTPSTAAPHIEAGKLIPLATTGLTRSPFMPNVPTIAESGYPGFNATNWYAFVAPGKTQVAVLERWNAELVKALNAPEVKAELDKHGLTPAPGSREELARTIASESKAWGQLIKERNIKAD